MANSQSNEISLDQSFQKWNIQNMTMNDAKKALEELETLVEERILR
jgi:hypothetical protein